MPVKPFTPQRIAMIDEHTYGVVFEEREEAMMCLRKNPRASTMTLETGEYVLVYSSADIDLKRAVVKR